MSDDILVVKNLRKNFGSLAAVDDLSFEVKRGEILGMIGPNGAGKTTVFNLLTGVIKPDEGSIVFDGRDITHESPANRCRLGIGRTFQIPQPFEKMTVFENILLAAAYGGGLSEIDARKKAQEILDFAELKDLKDEMAGALCLADRKRVELGRALATQPKLMLIDEVAGGLTDSEVRELMELVKRIREQGVSMMWIEHIMMTMSKGVDRLLVISEGRWLNCGRPEEVMSSNEVLECYLGADE